MKQIHQVPSRAIQCISTSKTQPLSPHPEKRQLKLHKWPPQRTPSSCSHSSPSVLRSAPPQKTPPLGGPEMMEQLVSLEILNLQQMKNKTKKASGFKNLDCLALWKGIGTLCLFAFPHPNPIDCPSHISSEALLPRFMATPAEAGNDPEASDYLLSLGLPASFFKAIFITRMFKLSK